MSLIIDPEKRKDHLANINNNISGPDITDRKVIVNSLSLKVERENAKAMIEGYYKDNVKYYVSMFVALKEAWSLKGNFRENPKLITTQRTERDPKYPLSIWGENMNAQYYDIPATYLAILDRIFHIDNNKEVWEILCNNGVFDIWKPIAPWNRLNSRKAEPRYPMILLIRIFNIDYDFSKELIEETHSHAVKQRIVNIMTPVIPNPEFAQITEKISDSIKSYIKNVEHVYNTQRLG
jgi:hypothetical protein